jgi:predicted nucleic acid-binding protein
MTVLVDSGPFIAMLDGRDEHHERALECLRGLEGERLLTSTFVLNEVATRGSALVGPRASAEFVRRVLASPLYVVFDVARDLLGHSLDVLVKYADQRLSLTDCTNLLLVRTARIRAIFTFDQAFRRIGMNVLP